MVNENVVIFVVGFFLGGVLGAWGVNTAWVSEASEVGYKMYCDDQCKLVKVEK